MCFCHCTVVSWIGTPFMTKLMKISSRHVYYKIRQGFCRCINNDLQLKYPNLLFWIGNKIIPAILWMWIFSIKDILSERLCEIYFQKYCCYCLCSEQIIMRKLYWIIYELWKMFVYWTYYSGMHNADCFSMLIISCYFFIQLKVIKEKNYFCFLNIKDHLPTMRCG